jgi:hypothetical protein
MTGIAVQLCAVDGVAAVVLGGSRARGSHRPDSDIDLGLYYRGELDVARLRRLAQELTGEQTDVTEPGGWGPWVDGGGWLTIDGWRVDWLYRDLDRVTRTVEECHAGIYEIGAQVGHPLGFFSSAYAGEVALCRVLADPSGEIAALKARLTPYPPKLRGALVRRLWEADFVTGIARYGQAAGDAVYVAGCLFRAIGLQCQALHAANGVWLVNEKGMVASAGRLPSAPEGYAERAQALMARVGSTPQELARTLEAAQQLTDEVRAATAHHASD